MSDRTPRLERFLGQAARIVSGGELHPVTVLQAVHDAAIRSVRDGAIANGYTVQLSPADMERLRPGSESLHRGICRMLDDIRTGGRLSIPAPWEVQLLSRQSLRPGQVEVEASFRNEQRPAVGTPGGPTRVIKRYRGRYLAFLDGRRVALTHTPFVIGRIPGCDLVIHDLAISRRHATVETAPDGGLVLRDLGSRNRLMVGGEHRDEVVLQPGERVTIGETTIWLEVSD